MGTGVHAPWRHLSLTQEKHRRDGKRTDGNDLSVDRAQVSFSVKPVCTKHNLHAFIFFLRKHALDQWISTRELGPTRGPQHTSKGATRWLEFKIRLKMAI